MSKRILVVDDDPDIQYTLQAILEYAEYEVEIASDGLAALKRLEKSLPDLILLDMMMPRMDGLTFLEELRRRNMKIRCPILVLSASPQLQQRTLQMGIRGFLHKPFELDDILETIASCL